LYTFFKALQLLNRLSILEQRIKSSGILHLPDFNSTEWFDTNTTSRSLLVEVETFYLPSTSLHNTNKSRCRCTYYSWIHNWTLYINMILQGYPRYVIHAIVDTVIQ